MLKVALALASVRLLVDVSTKGNSEHQREATGVLYFVRAVERKISSHPENTLQGPAHIDPRVATSNFALNRCSMLYSIRQHSIWVAAAAIGDAD